MQLRTAGRGHHVDEEAESTQTRYSPMNSRELVSFSDKGCLKPENSWRDKWEKHLHCRVLLHGLEDLECLLPVLGARALLYEGGEGCCARLEGGLGDDSPDFPCACRCLANRLPQTVHIHSRPSRRPLQVESVYLSADARLQALRLCGVQWDGSDCAPKGCLARLTSCKTS